MGGNRQCYWCGRPATSDDHVPAKCFFPKAARSSLIKVPSCDDHNNGLSKVDERFKNYIQATSRKLVAPRVDRKLEKQFFEKITRGLYYFYTGTPFHGSIKSCCAHGLWSGDDFERVVTRLGSEIVPTLTPGQGSVPGFFEYRHGWVNENGAKAFAVAGIFCGKVSFASIGFLTPLR